MKIVRLFIVLGVLSFQHFVATAQRERENKYSFKSMVVEYKIISGNDMMDTSKIESVGYVKLWIDNYGALQSELRTEFPSATALGKTSNFKQSTLNIIDGKGRYSIDLITNTGKKMNLRPMEEDDDFLVGVSKEQKGIIDPKNYVKEILVQNGGRWLGEENFLDKKCNVIELLGVKQWIYKGVMLKSEWTVSGKKFEEIAISIYENESINRDHFKVPVGVVISEMPNGINGGDEGYSNAKIVSKSTITLPFARFKDSVSKINQLGYSLISTIAQDGEYMSIFMKSDSVVFMVQASSIADLDLITGEDASVLEKSIINGHEAWIVQVKESEEGEMKAMNSVFIRYPEFGMNIIVAGPQGVAETLLKGVAQQLNF